MAAVGGGGTCTGPAGGGTCIGPAWNGCCDGGGGTMTVRGSERGAASGSAGGCRGTLCGLGCGADCVVGGPSRIGGPTCATAVAASATPVIASVASTTRSA